MKKKIKYIYTKHAAIDKFILLRKHKFKTKVTKKFLQTVIENPDHADKISDAPQIIASATLDSKHVLRVVYRREDDIIRVITFYPAEKGSYF